MFKKSIIFPDKTKDLWPKIKSQAALDGLDIGEWVTQTIETKLNPNSDLEADIDNVLDIEGIDAKIFTEHPELIKAVDQNFQFDYSDYNDNLFQEIRAQAAKLGIDLEAYRNE